MAKDDKKISKTSASEIETLRSSDGSPLLFQAVQKINQQPNLKKTIGSTFAARRAESIHSFSRLLKLRDGRRRVHHTAALRSGTQS
jgi:hypothetical protein